MTVASALRVLASYRLSHKVVLNIAQGSVVDFSRPKTGAIVNAANEMCLGGGGVDGAITAAGGANLAKDRLLLPTNPNGIRCPTGSAVITGPGDYGQLNVPYVIHAVGPNYRSYADFETPDNLLRSAYQSSLNQCRDTGVITDVAFALLSAGIFRGRRDSKDILQIGVQAIRDWMDDHEEDNGALESVTLCGYSSKETDLLLDICETDENEEL